MTCTQGLLCERISSGWCAECAVHCGGCQVSDRPADVTRSAAKLLGHNLCEDHWDGLLQVVVQRYLLILQQS